MAGGSGGFWRGLRGVATFDIRLTGAPAGRRPWLADFFLEGGVMRAASGEQTEGRMPSIRRMGSNRRRKRVPCESEPGRNVNRRSRRIHIPKHRLPGASTGISAVTTVRIPSESRSGTEQFTSSALVRGARASRVVKIVDRRTVDSLAVSGWSLPGSTRTAGRYRKARYSITTRTASPRRMSLTMVMDVAPPLMPTV